jgi:hypothetical protein
LEEENTRLKQEVDSAEEHANDFYIECCQLREYIEKMKCCGNCNHKMNLYGTCNKECECINYSNWELLE